MTPEQANAVYDILVARAGANEDDDSRDMFVQAQTSERCREYRFMGWLGFGGKLYVEPRGWRVGCYPESLTPGRQSIIDFTNAALADLYTKGLRT